MADEMSSYFRRMKGLRQEWEKQEWEKQLENKLEDKLENEGNDA